ncbi:MAG: WecB/TagA/CpsF family glycosyltransferase [Eubacteriales bacterium]|nr:WecB/TagA/CpsF family glycosyltransferase [Eubacteriales bacterium]MDD4390035.1 WecB/TagA/CpsF family glycosyltransferase [Eubacteriales bacterium]
MKSRRKSILGIPVDMVTKEEAFEIFTELMTRPGFDIIVTPNSEIVVNATEDDELAAIIKTAGLIIPDGIGLVYASGILGYDLDERITGIDFLTVILAYLENKGKSIYLLGSKPGETNEKSVAYMAGQAMKERFPMLKIAGTHHGYFGEGEEKAIVEEINASGADFLCVALGSPKQEKFLYRYKKDFTSAVCGIGVGGSLDVWAGTVLRAPEFYQKHGLEWLYRFIKQPSRFPRMIKLPIFILKVIAQKNRRSK